MNDHFDVIIVGGGPCGLACGIELQKKGLSHLIIEKASITESIRRYPKRMTFFSTAENLEIGGLPFAITGPKPTRDEALQYYRKVADYFKLNIRLFTTVAAVSKTNNEFLVKTSGGDYTAKNVVIATGYFDFPRKLNVPGEDLPHVAHYYEEAYQHAFTKIVIVGGGNSAIETALDLYRHNVDVTIVHRKPDFKPTAKYWLIPDIKNRIKEGKIKVMFDTEIEEIRQKEIRLKHVDSGDESTLPADFIYLLTGYTPDIELLEHSGIHVDTVSYKTTFNPDTYETETEGLYLCGTVLAGIQTESVFIENGREHAMKIAEHISIGLKV